jgi:uncharacterized protein (TIGR02271 family)
MALRDSNLNTETGQTERGVVAGLFRDDNRLQQAISDLKSAGFSDNQIGIARSETMGASQDSEVGTASSAVRGESRSMWDKIKSAFTGHDYTDDMDANYSTSEDFRGSLSGMGLTDDQSRYFSGNIHGAACLLTVRTELGRTSQAIAILERNGADLGRGSVEFGKTGASTTPSMENRRIQLLGEVLRVHKERVSRGEVRMRKEVVSETRNIQVPVTREELVVERTAVSDQQPASGQIGDNKEVRIPLSEERVRVEKQPVVTGEVKVGKRQVQDTQNVADNVRHEELRVEKEGDIADRDDANLRDRDKAA